LDCRQLNSQRRLNEFGARVSVIVKMLPKTEEGRYIGKQMLRAGLAAAPNYAEARAAESLEDFVHQLRIALKEQNERNSWLEQVIANGLFSLERMRNIIAKKQKLCWKRHSKYAFQSNLRFMISALRCRNRPISRFQIS